MIKSIKGVRPVRPVRPVRSVKPIATEYGVVLYKGKRSTIYLKDNKITKIGHCHGSEVDIQRIAARLGVAPEVYKVSGNIMEMEYIRGVELDQYLKLPGIDKNKTKVLVRSAINKLYNAGISHNDLTGRNILITPDHLVKIIDYGDSNLSSEPVPRHKRVYGVLRNF